MEKNMKKIGIVSKLDISGPGTRNIIYKDPNIDGVIYTNYLEVTTFELSHNQPHSPDFNHKNFYYLGQLVEYDEEDNTIVEIDPFVGLNREQLNDIQQILKIYTERLNELKSKDLLKDCFDLNEIKLRMKKIQERSLEQVNVELIINSIMKQLLLIKQFTPNINTSSSNFKK